MKYLFILLAVVFVVFFAVQIWAMNTQKDIEEYTYEVLETHENFEIRQYDATLFTSVKMNTNTYEEGSGKGFSLLAGYIFGGNESNEKIAMTSPVAMSLEDSMEMMFMVPKSYSMEELPTPNDSNIKFKEVPAKKVAAITFGGWANDAKIAEYKDKLITALREKNISHTNKYFFLGYNAPYEVVNRKNEVIVELN